MKILWITNILFPEALQLLTGKGDFRSSGGWMLGAANAILESNEDIILSVATVSQLVKKLTIIKGKDIEYYIIPYGKGNITYNSEYEDYWRKIKDLFIPDVIHIHGTEFSHGLSYINACGNNRVVVSVQGLKSGIAPYYCAGITNREIYSNITFRDLIKGNILSAQRSFYRSGKLERELLLKVKHIIGRTSWDKTQIWSINPQANYYTCNETLRDEFYDNSYWNYNRCEKYSIFLSQGSYPLKGFHQVLSAMPFILVHYPNATINIAGSDITQCKGIHGLLHYTGYGRLIKRMIKNLNLTNKVRFLGPLNAIQMKEAYLKSNVFVCPSSIENSPNSLGEAQLLGVPCIASYVGGIPDMMQGNEENLYRFEEVKMLAEKICRVFANEDKQINMSEIASIRHHPIKNAFQLLMIYKKL